MKCLNPACGSVRANELNVSLNVTMTIAHEDTEYEGGTEYGDLSMGIGTTCPDCNLMTYQYDYLKIITDEFRVSEDLIERGWAAVLPKPITVHVVAWYSEYGGEGTSGGFDWFINEEVAASSYANIVRDEAGLLSGKHVTVLSRVSIPPNVAADAEDSPNVSEYLNGMTDALENRVADESVTVIAVSISERKDNA